MTHNESPQKIGQPSMFSTWIGMVLLFAFFGLLALVILRASPRGGTYEEKEAKERFEKLVAAHEQDMKALTTYAWVDKTKGVVRIPISEAMQLTVAELAQTSPVPANPIAVPEASPAAPAAASPAASPSTTSSGTPKPSTVSGPDSTNRSQPAAANNPPPAPPATQPGPSTPVTSPSSAAAKAPVTPAALPAPSAPGTPLPVRGKTP